MVTAVLMPIIKNCIIMGKEIMDCINSSKLKRIINITSIQKTDRYIPVECVLVLDAVDKILFILL